MSAIELRGYSESEFNNAFKQVNHQHRAKYLEEKEKNLNKKAPLVFTTTYNPHVSGFRRALLKNWEIIGDSEYLKTVFPDKPILAVRRNKNLSDTLVRARLKPCNMETTTCSDTNDLDLLISLLRRDPDSGI